MNKLRSLLKSLSDVTNYLSTFLPSRLPTGRTQFDKWARSIIRAYGEPNGIPDNESVRQALAVQIMHLGQAEAFKPKRFFGKVLLKGAASQVAHSYMLEVQEEHKRKIAAEAAANESKEQTVPSAAS